MATVATVIPYYEAIKRIGKFPGVIQIAASHSVHQKLQQEKAHELIKDGPQGPLSEAAGDLTYHGGPVIDQGKARVANVYLGNTVVADKTAFDNFSRDVVEGTYYLSPDGKDATPGKMQLSFSISWPFPSKVVDDSAIETWVDHFAASQPASDGIPIYMLIMEEGSTVTMQGSASCSAFCGYHSMTSQGHYYAVMCDTSCAGCNAGSPLEGLMMVWSHEYAEWRSDPQGSAWFNSSTGMENADECAWQRVQWGPWAVQPMWVNGRQCYTGPYTAVVPGPPPPPPGSVTTKMEMNVQPQNGQVGVKMADFSVKLEQADGSVNTADSTTTVVCALPGFSNTQTAKAVNGIVTFHGDTAQSPHTGLYYHFTSGSLPPIDSAKFDVLANTPPPPPPPIGTPTLQDAHIYVRPDGSIYATATDAVSGKTYGGILS